MEPKTVIRVIDKRCGAAKDVIVLGVDLSSQEVVRSLLATFEGLLVSLEPLFDGAATAAAEGRTRPRRRGTDQSMFDPPGPVRPDTAAR